MRLVVDADVRLPAVIGGRAKAVLKWIALACLLPLIAAAQQTPKIEVFGGYSFLGLSSQPRLQFGPASWNGWKASVKLHLTRRIGILSDFSGHYGQMRLKPGGLPGTSVSRRQHAYLFGVETLVLESPRVRLNARGLMGVAQTNASALPPPIPTIAGSTFAAAFGGSVEYRITDRLSYRILEPEVLVTRSGSSASNNWQHYSFQAVDRNRLPLRETRLGRGSGPASLARRRWRRSADRCVRP